eukprot:TRINITY_DN8_c0_g5_i1.p1 TRINITY_DN8_c0_g5~~TRINITY_DN8_c0_g5_i1.p1  ORF type:complete len:1159 (-),score=273.19 TRINITY_DN8_c0_g5_i1:1475-4951(-)
MAHTVRLFRTSAVCIAVYGALHGVAFAHQQESSEANSDEDTIEVIEVSGLKGSIKKSINDKRFSDNISDSINAEDIGKSTDQNIADALSRVTGVSVQSVDGEGTAVTVRGANAQQNNISLNGVTLSSTDYSQSVDLSQFSSDILSKIEVVKTPSADHEEGALGANINLISAKPLDLDYVVRSVTVQGRYNDLAEEQDYKISGSFSEKFFDDTFGIIVTAYKETNSVRKDEYLAQDWRARQSQKATDTNGNIQEDVWGVSNYFTQYSLNQNTRDREGIDISLQWIASERTNIDVSLNWSQQSLSSSMHGARTRGADYPNLIEGEDPGLNIGPAASTDPTELWHTIDMETQTFTKWTNRFGLGDLIQAENDFDNENQIASLNITHQLTDNIEIQLGGGYSKAEQKPGNNIYVALQNYNNINAWSLYHTPSADMEPVGYDCTNGPCQLVGGVGLIDYGAIESFDDPNSVWDNRSTTGFNPDELEAQHLTYLNRTVTRVEDEQKSAHIDIDWYTDWGPVTSFEFGAKWSSREKFVDAQSQGFNSAGEGVVITNPDTGLPTVLQNGLVNITADMFATNEDFPVSDFMASLGYGKDNFTDGWTTFSATQAFNLALGSPEVAITPDNTNTRYAELENIAAYFKTNFEFIDGRLTGDIGVRYVQTEVNTQGYSGVNFHSDPGNLGRTFDPFVLRELMDDSLPLCPGILFYGTNYNDESRWSRVDGLGWDTVGTGDYRDDVALADVGPCHDPRAVQGHPEQADWWLWRHSDVSTESYYVYGERQFDENGNLVPTEDRSRRAFGVTDEHDYSLLLPSLNLNYAISEEMIGRLALSKTMSRPQIDSLRPGFKVTETVWGGNDRNNIITLTNTKLDPLESKNVDLSFEWYFNNSSLIALGLFYKDMTNFEESETVLTYMDDIRDIGLDPDEPNYDVNDLVLIGGQDDLSECMPKRFQGNLSLSEDWLYSDDLSDLCAVFKTTRIKNGKGASIAGVELQYMQTFDTLPGWMSGLGIQTNYTYQDSEYDQEVSSIDSNVVLPALPVAYTPEHSYNLTAFWEKQGHQIRISYQGTSDQLAQRSWEQGSLWEEGRNTLDFSASYKFNEHTTFTFQAVNLTDEGVRQYFTSRFINLGGVVLDEGNPLDGNATSSRTVREYRTGTTYRLGMRVNFF